MNTAGQLQTLGIGGMPTADISLWDCDNVSDVLIRAATDAPDDIYCRYGANAFSRSDILVRSISIANSLRALGLEKGDRVAVMLPNSPDYIAIVFAVARCRMTWIPINTRLRSEGLRHVLDHSEPALLIADTEFTSALEAALPERLQEAVIWCEGAQIPTHEDYTASVARSGATPRMETDVLCISYTSGTTGPAKGVLVTHRMMAAAAQAVILLADARDGDRMVLWEPLYHIGGSQLLLLPLIRRISLHLTDKFRGKTFLSIQRQVGATQFHYLGGVLALMLKQPAAEGDQDHKLRVAWGAGAMPAMWHTFEERFGVAIRECYGMTETSSIVTCNFDGVVGSVGRPLPWFSATILREDGSPASAGERGEIVVRELKPGLLIKRYFKNEDATARSLRDGALHTGDLGSVDEHGNFFFHGRMTDSVRTKGENVSAYEVEHVLSKHPDIEECALIGVPSSLGEYDLKIFVRAARGRDVDFGEVVAWCADKMAPFQVPRYFASIDEFEKTASERIKKHLLSPSTEGCWDRLGESLS